jgi:alkylation response protein AidB-like acyl-CoA dehydrogenase
VSTSTQPAPSQDNAAQPDRELPGLLYGEAEEELRAAVRDLLQERAGWSAVLARTETGEPYDTGLWRVLAADVGCAGLLIPESHGGAGASYREAAVVAEEAGRAVAPVPYLGSAVVATAAALSAGDAELLSGLAEGTVTAALAVPFASKPSAGQPSVGQPSAGQPSVSKSGPSQQGTTTTGTSPAATVRVVSPQPGDAPGQARLTGVVAGVADALPASVLLVPADGVPSGLYTVEAGAPGLTVTPVVSLDQTRPLADLSLDSVPARLLASGPDAGRAVAAALAAGAAMLAAEQLGVAERCLEMTVTYLKERYQFARPIGSFQALKHRAADLWVAISQARAASRYAAACLADGDADAPVAVALAKAACGDAATLAAQECVQLHGGIGFTWEHPAHLYLKRATSSSIGFGTPDWHRASLASLAGLPPAPAGPQ